MEVFNNNIYRNVHFITETTTIDSLMSCGMLIGNLTEDITTTLPGSANDGEMYNFKRIDAAAKTWTISPNDGQVLNISGTTGDTTISLNSYLTLMFCDGVWYDTH